MKRFIPFLILGILCFVLMPCAGAEVQKEYQVYKGLFHVHSQYSHDSNASLSYLTEVTKELNADFMVITDHNNQNGKSVYKQRIPSDPLLLFGNEVSVLEGHLIAFNVPSNPPEEINSAKDLIAWINSHGGHSILAHPWSRKEPWKNLGLEGWHGFELYNFGDEVREESWGLLIDSHFAKDHDLVLDQTQEVEPSAIQFWDEEMKRRGKIVPVFAGSNAHFRRYKKEFKMSLESMSQYVWAEARTPEALTRALGEGRGFLVFERGISLKDFFFGVVQKERRIYPGQSVPLESPAVLMMALPKEAEMVFFQDGVEISRQKTQTFSFPVTEPGIYRAKAFLDGKPWIYTNALQLTSAQE